MTRRFCIHVITKNGTNPAYEGARVGASRVAERMGGEVRHSYPSVPDDSGQQEALLVAALEAGADAIVLAPTHPTALNATLERVQAADVPLVYFVSCTEDLLPACYVTADNHALAKTLADEFLARLGRRGDIAIVEGSPDSVTSAPRTRGFLEAAATCPDVRVVARRTADYQREPARAAMAEVLKATGAVDGVLCANDYMAMGVLDALDAAGQRAAVAGVNAMPEAIQAIQSGRMVLTAAYDAMKMGCIATEAAFRLLTGLPVPTRIELPVALVDATCCAPYARPYAQRDLPEWSQTITAR